MRVRFLLDEDISPRLCQAILRRDPRVDVLRVGDEGAPPLGTLDPDILRYVSEHRRLLITENRRSMPGHINHHVSTGEHHWGVLRLRPRATFAPLLETILTIRMASEAEEWIDHLGWIPY